MFIVIISTAMFGILAGFVACLLCNETYDEELVSWDGQN